MMRCAQKKCLASIEWFGPDDDPILTELAKGRGWRVHESKGWLCPHHHRLATGDTNVRDSIV